MFAGIPVCRKGFQLLLGVGNERMDRIGKRFRGADFRKMGNNTGNNPASNDVAIFLQRVYWPGNAVLTVGHT